MSILKSTQESSRIIAGYALVIYDDRWCVAYINGTYPEKSEIAVNFLHPSGSRPSFLYPRHPDMFAMDASDVILQLHPTTKTGRTYCLPEEEMRTAIDAFALSKSNIEKHFLSN